MGNRIGKEYLSTLQEIMRSKPNLISLCGIADDAAEADLSGLKMDSDDAIILAAELSDKRALSKLIFGGPRYRDAGGDWVTPEPATLKLGMTELDLSNKGLQVADAIIVAAWISHKDKGTISKFVFSGDDNDMAKSVTMDTSMVEADFGGKCLGVSGAIMVAAFLPKCT
jgi:hypothetical protein